jgi:glutamate 5-kinase
MRMPEASQDPMRRASSRPAPAGGPRHDTSAVTRRPVVVKLGSSTLVDGRGRLRRTRLDALASDIAGAWRDGTRVAVVSSGAIALGLGVLGRAGRPARVAELQAAAAVGQAVLQRAWQRALTRHGGRAAQVLLTAAEVRHRGTYLNARATLETLLSWGITPVVNENDSTATDEITFGDNDALAAQVALMLRARLLVLLTDQDGLFTRDPRERGAELVPEVTDHELLRELDVARPGSAVGSGGMRSKVVAAEMAGTGGVPSVIANGASPGVLRAAIAGEPTGTRFHADARATSAFKLWVRYGRPAVGRIEVDAGARRAVARDGASLLAVGVVGVHGRFAAGDAVDIVGPDGVAFAKGLAQRPAAELRAAAGTRGAEPAVHRDDLVLLD